MHTGKSRNEIKFPKTLIKVIALKQERFIKDEFPKFSVSSVIINKGDIFLVELDDFNWSRFKLYTLDKEYVCDAYNDGYSFEILANFREKRIDEILED